MDAAWKDIQGEGDADWYPAKIEKIVIKDRMEVDFNPEKIERLQTVITVRWPRHTRREMLSELYPMRIRVKGSKLANPSASKEVN